MIGFGHLIITKLKIWWAKVLYFSTIPGALIIFAPGSAFLLAPEG